MADHSPAKIQAARGWEEAMALKIVRVSDDLYSVCATPPEVREEWASTEPIRGRQLTRELLDRGAHQTDVGDAMYEADPDWIGKLRDPRVTPPKQ